MRRCGPIRRHRGQAGRGEEEKGIRWEIVCEGPESAWCLSERRGACPLSGSRGSNPAHPPLPLVQSGVPLNSHFCDRPGLPSKRESFPLIFPHGQQAESVKHLSATSLAEGQTRAQTWIRGMGEPHIGYVQPGGLNIIKAHVRQEVSMYICGRVRLDGRPGRRVSVFTSQRLRTGGKEIFGAPRDRGKDHPRAIRSIFCKTVSKP